MFYLYLGLALRNKIYELKAGMKLNEGTDQCDRCLVGKDQQ